MKAMAELSAWFVTGSQHLYGEDALEEVRVHAAAIAAALDASDSIPVRIIAKPVVTTPESIATLLAEADADGSCVGVVAWMHTFSPARMWIGGLRALRKPLVHLHTQANRDLPWAEIDMDFMNLNQSAHGDREFGYVLTRLGVTRTTVVGHWQDPAVSERIGLWSRAAAGVAEARRLRICRFGDNMRQVAVTEGDKVEAQSRLGFSVNGYGVNDLVAACRDATDAEVGSVVAEYLDRYDVVPELRRGGDRHSSLRDAARIEVGLRRRLVEGDFGAFTDTFEDLGELPQLPGIAVQRLMADGYGFGGEGDWKTAALVRLLKVMAGGLPGGTSFMEDYTYHFGAPRPRILGAHMLEVCPSIAGARPSCEIHPLAIGGKADPVRLVFTARPGPGIVVGLIDLGDRFRLVANEVDLIEPDAPLPRLPVARAVWEPRPDLGTAASAWLTAGGPHHTGLSIGLPAEVVSDFAAMVGVELALIDGGTTVRQLSNELRWNNAAYRLGRA
jgi:L-arabinose isomerase